MNDAQNSKDDARQKHIFELYYYWYYYYQIRSLTLWDFRTNTELEDFDEIIRNRKGRKKALNLMEELAGDYGKSFFKSANRLLRIYA